MEPTISEASPLLLGSASPRRRRILGDLGLPVIVFPADVSEEQRARETAMEYLDRVVNDKLQAVVASLKSGRADVPTRFAGVLVADTIVVADGAILGKPRDTPEAEILLGRLVGRTHTVLTRFCIAKASELPGYVCARTVRSDVTMRRASQAEVRRYALTREGLDKAGAYAVQGIGAFLVESIVGSYTNVVGLPACEVVSELLACRLLLEYP